MTSEDAAAAAPGGVPPAEARRDRSLRRRLPDETGVLIALTGGLLGLVNGLLAVGLRMPVIIITLGTAYAYRGLPLVVTGSHAVAPTDTSSPFSCAMAGWSSPVTART